MSSEEVKQIVQQAFPGSKVEVEELQGKYIVSVIGDIFKDMSSLERQKEIYAPLTQYITEGKLHAVSVRGYTQEEWADASPAH